jgi:hypothetical protein
LSTALVLLLALVAVSYMTVNAMSTDRAAIDNTSSQISSQSLDGNATGNSTEALATVTSINWAGHTFDVTDYRGGTITSNSVWVDAQGLLHMKLIYDGTWHDFNLIQRDYAHYGTYQWTIATDVDYIMDKQNGGNPYFLVSPFLYDNKHPETNYNEMDIEFTKWGYGDTANPPFNTDWTNHKGDVNYNGDKQMIQYNHFTGAGNICTLEWMPDHVKWSIQGPNQPYKEWVCTTSLPVDTGTMQHIITTGEVQNHAPPNNMAYYEAETVFSSYTFTPYGATPKPTVTPAPTPAPTATPKPTVMPTPTPAPTATPKPTVTPTATPRPTATPAPSPVSSIQWAGHTFDVTDYAGGQFTTNNVMVDLSGRLHMKLIYDGKWHDFNLVQQDKAGYGTYKWTVASDVDNVIDSQNGGNPYFLFSPFLFDGSNSREMDIQMTKGGVSSRGYNTNWTVVSTASQTQANHIVGAGNTWTLEWMPDHVKFSVQGPNQSYKEWVITDTSKIPANTGNMKSLMTIGQINKASPPNNLANYQAEVVLSAYSFTPYKAASDSGATSLVDQIPAVAIRAIMGLKALFF